MPKTAIGLFNNIGHANDVVREIEAIGFPRNEVRVASEPLDFGVSGVTSIPEIDYEVELTRELMRIGTTQLEAVAYVDGVRHGEVLVFATGAADQVDLAVGIMNRSSAILSQEVTGQEPELQSGIQLEMAAAARGSSQIGRVRSSGDGATAFVW